VGAGGGLNEDQGAAPDEPRSEIWDVRGVSLRGLRVSADRYAGEEKKR
jgi:hypothetical protein